jgi:hypothetical protein
LYQFYWLNITFASVSNSSFDSTIAKGSSKIAFAMKTGKETGVVRLPLLLLTYLKHFQNVLFFSDEDIQIGNIHVTGVVSLSSKLKKEGSTGWDLDQHKFFPGFMRLYELFPSCDWYIMLDDDTYIILDNLNGFLSEFDPLEKHFFGSPRLETGCTQSKHQDTYFAMGGAGVILSRGAMLTLHQNINKCEKFYVCDYGDGALGECLREIGVLFHKNVERMLDLFNGETPSQHDFPWVRDSCKRPITFHHVKPHDTQRLYEIDTINPNNLEKKPVTYELVYNKFETKGRYYENYKGTGKEIEVYKTDSKVYCADECNKLKTCKAWLIDVKRGTCSLLRSIESMEELPNFHFGISKNADYSCKYLQ